MCENGTVFHYKLFAYNSKRDSWEHVSEIHVKKEWKHTDYKDKCPPMIMDQIGKLFGWTNPYFYLFFMTWTDTKCNQGLIHYHRDYDPTWKIERIL